MTTSAEEKKEENTGENDDVCDKTLFLVLPHLLIRI